jgi:hypothetical protein
MRREPARRDVLWLYMGGTKFVLGLEQDLNHGMVGRVMHIWASLLTQSDQSPETTSSVICQLYEVHQRHSRTPALSGGCAVNPHLWRCI